MAQPQPEHSHTHAPGQPPHSHGPPQPQQPQMVVRPPDPVMQALIEATFQPVDINLGPPDNASALCGAHSLEKCAVCDVDYVALNRLSKLLHANPALRCPPPPQIVTQKLTQVINNTKDEGNAFYKAGSYDKAIQRYSMAAGIAVQRAPWEAQQLMREELSTVLSNRSAAYYSAGDYIGSLVDAEIVIQIRRPWSKGHFRKAKALQELHQFDEAKEAVQLGLSYEPGNVDMQNLLTSIEAQIQGRGAKRSVEKSSESAPS